MMRFALAFALFGAASVSAQTFTEGPINEGGGFQEFDLDSGTADGDISVPSLDDGGALLPGSAPQGAFQTFPGVSGPVTSVTQPETGQGATVTLRALDKMLGTPTDISLAIGQTVVFGRIAISAIECRYPSSDPASDAYAHLEVLDLEGESLFDGWMVASSPALSALEHARYDVWVLGCTP